jgi:hypothetical protein
VAGAADGGVTLPAAEGHLENQPANGQLVAGTGIHD